jgi:hypothetical protein
MREILVSHLVKEVLGPRGGLREDICQSPLNEYTSGVLAPIVPRAEREIESDSEIPTEETDTFEEDTAEVDVSAPPTFSPALDPKRRPPTMGISFVVSAMDKPGIRVCLTWARYRMAKKADRTVWHREPRFAILKLVPESNAEFWLDAKGNRVDPNSAEISFHMVVRSRNLDHSITMYVVNRLKVPEGEIETSEYHVFQPQIRIICDAGTVLLPGRSDRVPGRDERILDFLYRNQKVLARGHMCSAVWKQIDPEIQPEKEIRLDFPEVLKQPPFFWIDGDLLPPEARGEFSLPDIRTEFVPAYSIPSPDLRWRSEYGNSPELKAETLSQLWDPEQLRAALGPIVESYGAWITSLESELQGMAENESAIARGLIEDCQTVRERIQNGLDMICTDEQARLAFCFANKALDIQSNWPPRKAPLVWYPFQLAFILMSIESIVNPRSRFRKTCDLIWVPTGAGKTEAYLAVVAFTLAYRRRRALRLKSETEDRTGAGVAVIARYTLRLLTIQQFRRTLSLITACELMRVLNEDAGTVIGWKPIAYKFKEGTLWGTSPFSVGLWVGGEVTPNRLEDGWGGDQPILGAISILRGTQGEKSGEPAQILTCPSCDHILAVPDMGLETGRHSLHWVVQAEGQGSLLGHLTPLRDQRVQNAYVRELQMFTHADARFLTLSVDVESSVVLRSEDIDGIWNRIRDIARTAGFTLNLIPARASRPGYFIRSYVNTKGRNTDIDFEIFCPNPSCELHRYWQGGAPAGWVNGSTPEAPAARKEDLPDGNSLVQVHEAFRTSDEFTSDRIPIPALTVDDQIYQRLPSVVVATVDKFARPPFEPRAASLFGNVDHHSFVWGYYRLHNHPKADSSGHRPPTGRGTHNYRQIPSPEPPELILQDELHLIEGPLGSLVGFYESAVDYLCMERHGTLPKYIASTATIRRAEDQVLATFARNVHIFPPPGLRANDRFYIVEGDIHQLNDNAPGRLYVGVCAPGRGPLTPLVRIWARLLQTVWENRTNPNADAFWTLTGYFNAVRELAGARALYRQDIPQRINELARQNPRPVTDERAVELSSRTPSTDLPSILDLLDQEELKAPEVLFTTSMFGTGVDISRIALMVVNGQPKTTSAYIQSTGRVGRSSGALVVTFFRASRPRDLSHYEFFSGYHRQLHRYVEPITVYPFAPGVIERAAGPVAVFILRNRRAATAAWFRNDSAVLMGTSRTTAGEVLELPELFEDRAQGQPRLRRPDGGAVRDDVNAELDRWQSSAMRWTNLVFVDWAIGKTPTDAEVLGDSQHQHASVGVIFENAPQSLRDVEETTGFQT